MPPLTCQRAVTHPCAGITVLSWSVCFYHVFKSFLKSSSYIAVPTEGLMLFEVLQILTRLNLGSVGHGQVTLRWTKLQGLSSFWISSHWHGCFSWISFKPHKFAHGWEARRESVFQRPWCVLSFPNASCGISFLLPFQCSWFLSLTDNLVAAWQAKGSRLEAQVWVPSRGEPVSPHWPKYKDGQTRRWLVDLFGFFWIDSGKTLDDREREPSWWSSK